MQSSILVGRSFNLFLVKKVLNGLRERVTHEWREVRFGSCNSNNHLHVESIYWKVRSTNILQRIMEI